MAPAAGAVRLAQYRATASAERVGRESLPPHPHLTSSRRPSSASVPLEQGRYLRPSSLRGMRSASAESWTLNALPRGSSAVLASPARDRWLPLTSPHVGRSDPEGLETQHGLQPDSFASDCQPLRSSQPSS